MAGSWQRGRWTICGGSTVRATPASKSCFSSSPAGRTCASSRRGWGMALREAAVAVAGDRAEVADRAATDPRGALARRQRQAADADRGGPRLLGRRVRRALQDPQVLPRRGGAGPPARRETARARAVVVHRDPRAFQRHHGPVELLPREGPRPPRLGARRLAADLPREAGGGAGALVVDGGAPDRADAARVRRA